MSFDTRSLKIGDKFVDISGQFIGIVIDCNENNMTYQWTYVSSGLNFYREIEIPHSFSVTAGWTPLSSLLEVLL